MSCRLFRFIRATLVVAALLLAGCPEGGGQSDAGTDSGWDVQPVELEVGLGRAEQDQFVEMTGSQPTLEVVSGFQGGYHIEPALRIEEPPVDEFITVVEYRVTDVDTGEVLTADPMSYRVDARAWNHQEGAYVRTWERVILNVLEASEAAGRTVRIDVSVEVEGGLGGGQDSVTVDLVNEVDELR